MLYFFRGGCNFGRSNSQGIDRRVDFHQLVHVQERRMAGEIERVGDHLFRQPDRDAVGHIRDDIGDMVDKSPREQQVAVVSQNDRFAQ